jgi:hypothetical protein
MRTEEADTIEAALQQCLLTETSPVMFGHAARTEQAYVNQSVLFPKAYIVK